MTINELLQRWRDGSITSDELRELSARLSEPGNQSALLEDWLLESSLPDRLTGAMLGSLSEAATQRRTRLVKVAEQPQTKKWSGRRFWQPFAAAAAAIAILSGLAAWWQHHVGRVGFEVLAATIAPYQAGDQVRRSKIEFESGILNFRLTSGAEVELKGPVTLDLLTPMHVRLRRGSLTADVGTMAKGFIVDTADARVVDIGTRFGVTSGSADATDVTVFEGSVEVYKPGPSTSSKPDVTLVAGDAIRVERAGKSKRLRMVHLSRDGSSLEAHRSSDVVSAVTDNVMDVNFRGYYGLLPGGMDEGARVYTTGHTRTWHALPGGTFPAELRGADVVCTFGEDRIQPDLEITLLVEEPCDVFVMPDTRVPLPEWIVRDFQNTGLQLRCGPWVRLPNEKEGEMNGYVTHTVWKKTVPHPGAVKLGPPQSGTGKRWAAMYGIAVKKIR